LVLLWKFQLTTTDCDSWLMGEQELMHSHIQILLSVVSAAPSLHFPPPSAVNYQDFFPAGPTAFNVIYKICIVNCNHLKLKQFAWEDKG